MLQPPPKARRRALSDAQKRGHVFETSPSLLSTAHRQPEIPTTTTPQSPQVGPPRPPRTKTKSPPAVQQPHSMTSVLYRADHTPLEENMRLPTQTTETSPPHVVSSSHSPKPRVPPRRAMVGPSPSSSQLASILPPSAFRLPGLTAAPSSSSYHPQEEDKTPPSSPPQTSLSEPSSASSFPLPSQADGRISVSTGDQPHEKKQRGPAGPPVPVRAPKHLPPQGSFAEYSEKKANKTLGKKLDAKEQKRVETDLFTSEDEYVGELLSCLSTFSHVIRRATGPQIANELFSLLPNLVKSHARACAGIDYSLLSFSSHLRNTASLYREYIDQYNITLYLIQALESEPFFKDILLAASRHGKSNQWIRNSLGAPIRRITQYAYYFDSLAPCFEPNSLDRQSLASTSKAFHELQNHFLESVPDRAPEDQKPISKLKWLMKMNPNCADCSSTRIRYLSTPLGILLCPDCGLAHLSSLPNNVSLVERISLGCLGSAISWISHPRSGEILMYAMRKGNLSSNGVWEFMLSSSNIQKPNPESSADEKGAYIVKKYLEGSFLNPDYGFPSKVQRDLSKKWADRILRLEATGEYPNRRYKLNFFTPRVETERANSIPLEGSVISLYDENPRYPYVQLVDSKGDSFIFDFGDKFGSFSFLFWIHRASPGVMKSPLFLLSQWLDHSGWFNAVSNGDMKTIQEYLADNKSYCWLANEEKLNAAHLGARNENLELLRILAEGGTSFFEKDKHGASPLHYIFSASWENADLNSITRLLETILEQEKESPFNQQTDEGETVLHLCVKKGKGRLLPYLLSKKAGIDIQDKNGATPLMVALRGGLVDESMNLIEAGADLFIKTNHGDNALSAVKDLENEVMYQTVFERYEKRRISQTANIIKEIISTEETYLHQLEILVFIYKTKFEADLPVSQRAIQSLFSNVSEIYAECVSFFKEISEVINLPPESQDVGRRFLNRMDYIRKHGEYCKYQGISSKSLKVMMMDPVIKEWAESSTKDIQSKESLEGYLIKPVQRICRFQLLLRELLKYTNDTYEDTPRLQEAFDQIGEILQESNEHKRKLDHIEEIVEGLSALGVVFSVGSLFLEEGKAKVYSERFKDGVSSTYFLFSDVLIIVRGEQPKWIPIDVIILTEAPFLYRCKDDSQSFDIVRLEKTLKVTFELPSPEEMERLLAVLSDTILPFSLKEKIKLANECREKQMRIWSFKDQFTWRKSLILLILGLFFLFFWLGVFIECFLFDCLFVCCSFVLTIIFDLSKYKTGTEKEKRNKVEGGRREVSLGSKLAKKVGRGEEEESILSETFEKLGRSTDRRLLRGFLERLSPIGTNPEKRAHKFERHHFRSPRWCDFCHKFIFGLRYQGDKCKECSYSGHYKCTKQVGDTCLSEYALRVWGRRDAHEIVNVLFKKSLTEYRFCTLILFNDSMEILVSHCGSSSQSNPDTSFLTRVDSVPLEGTISNVEKAQFSLTTRNDTFWFRFASDEGDEGATAFWEKASPLVRKGTQRNTSFNSLQRSDPTRKTSTPSPPPSSVSSATFSGPSFRRSQAQLITDSPPPGTLSYRSLSPTSAISPHDRERTPPPVVISPPPPQEASLLKSWYTVEVNCDYTGTSSAELSIKVGERLVVEEMEGEWWLGYHLETPESRGWFPASYVNP